MNEPAFIDTHAHLQTADFDTDRIEVIQRYRDAGVRWIVVPGTDMISSDLAGRLAQQEPDVFAALGLHPEDCTAAPADYIDQLHALLALYHDRTVAIGEIGLDFKEGTPDRTLQRRIFEEQLQLATDCGLPVIVHSRFSTGECLDTMKAFPGLRGVMHCFGGTPADVKRVIKLGLYISFTGNITYHGNDALRKALMACPLDHLLLETDSPYLAPVPVRGKRNEPAFVAYSYQAVCSMLGRTLSDLSWQLKKNAEELFLQGRRSSDHVGEKEVHDHA